MPISPEDNENGESNQNYSDHIDDMLRLNGFISAGGNDSSSLLFTKPARLEDDTTTFLPGSNPTANSTPRVQESAISSFPEIPCVPPPPVTCEPTHSAVYASDSSLSGDRVASANVNSSRVSRENKESKQKRCSDRAGRGVDEESSGSYMDNWRNGKVACCFGSFTVFLILLTDKPYGLSKTKTINGGKSDRPDANTVLNALIKKLGALPRFSKAYNDIRQAAKELKPKADGKLNMSSALSFSAKPSNISTNKDSHLRFRKCLKEIVRLYYNHINRPEGAKAKCYNMEEISGEDSVDWFHAEVIDDKCIRVKQHHGRGEGSGSLQTQNVTSSTPSHPRSSSLTALGENVLLRPTEVTMNSRGLTHPALKSRGPAVDVTQPRKNKTQSLLEGLVVKAVMEIHCDPVLHLKSQEDAMNRGTYEASSIRSRLSKAFADHDVEIPDISFPEIMCRNLLSYKKNSGGIYSEKWLVSFKFENEKFFKDGLRDTKRCDELIGMLRDLFLKSEIKFEKMWCEPGSILCRAIISSREIANVRDKCPIILGMFRKLFESEKIKSVPTLSVAKINQSKNSGYLSARRLKVHAQASWTATLHMIDTLLRPASLPSGLHVKKMDFFPVICPHASTEISSRFMDKLHLIAGLIRVFKQLFPDGPIWARIFGIALEFLGLDYHISSMDGDTTCTGFPSIRSTRGETNRLSPGVNVSELRIQRTPDHSSDAEIGLKLIRRTRKRDVPHALGRTSQDSERLGSLKYLELDGNPLDYTQINPHTFGSLIEVEMDPDRSIIQNRMRIAREQEQFEPDSRTDDTLSHESDKMDPYESDHIMDVEGCDNNHSHGSPSLFDLDVSRGHQAPTRGPHMQVTVNQDSKVKANQHPPSPMSVVEPAQAGGFTFLPSVNVPSQVGSISHVGVHGLTSLESKREKIQPPKAKKQRRVRHESICKWCGSICKNGLTRHLRKCEDGLFEAVCYAIRVMFVNSKYKITKGDVRKAYCVVIKSTKRKAELISCIKERMTCRIKNKITHMVRAPRSNWPGYKAFQGLDAMVCLFFRLFNLKMPFAAGLDSYNFTGFDADISAEVKKFILKWILMTRKTAGRDGLNAIGYTSQDSLSNGGCKVVLDMSPEDWNALEETEYDFLRDKNDDLKKLGSMVKNFELRLLNLAPKERFAWLRCFLVTLREFSVEALELKTLPNGDVKYRNLESDKGKDVLDSMSTFVMQNYDKLVESFRVVESQDHETELRLQLLRAILAMPSDRRTSHLITLAEELVRRLSKDVPDRFSSHFGDVSLVTSPGFWSPSETLSIAESAQTDLVHFVHAQGSRSSRMCLLKEGILKPISEDQDNLHSTALDLFINRGLNFKAVSSLPDFINSQTLRIASNEQWKAMSLETKSAWEFAKLGALIVTKCPITKLEIGTFLKRFPDLRCIRLVNNDISTFQPGVLDHLRRLEILDLSFNSIASIPSDVFKACKSLREVHLVCNKIRTVSPRAFEGLSNLKILRLGRNKIHSLAKDVFHGLESLKKLDLSYNKLQSLDKGTFDDLKSLRYLDLEHNELKSLDKRTFNNLRSLEELVLSNNKLQRLPVGLFQTLKWLRELYLNNNQLQSLDNGTFHDLKSLRELDLRSNQLQSLDESTFDDLRWLRELYLNNNQLQRLGKWTFGDLKSLAELDLSDNKLQRLPVGLFQTLKSLRKLNLSFNQLQSLDKGTFDDLKSLEELNLHSNKLQRLPVGLFQTLKSLSKLGLSNNQLQSLDKGTLDDFKSLRELYLSNNQLQSLDKGTFDDLKSLRKLNLSFNQLQSLGKGTFDDLKSLRELDLRSNQLQSLDERTFDDLRWLRELYLNNNQLQSLGKWTFGDLKSLEELDLSDNKLQRLPVGLFQAPKWLRKLNLSFNQLQSLGKGTFDDLKSLRELDLSFNQLQSLDKGTFGDFKSLRKLSLSNNQLQSLDKGTFNDLKSLEELDLLGNKLHRLPLGLFQTPKSLRKLNLSFNQLQSLDKGTFDDLKSLEELDLSNTKLQRLPVGLFQTLKSLRKLDLSFNQLQSLDKGTFADLKSLKYLELEKNPLDYTKVDPTTFDSLNEVEMHPDLPTIRNRMRETPEEREKRLESELFPKKLEGLRQQMVKLKMTTSQGLNSSGGKGSSSLLFTKPRPLFQIGDDLTQGNNPPRSPNVWDFLQQPSGIGSEMEIAGDSGDPPRTSLLPEVKTDLKANTGSEFEFPVPEKIKHPTPNPPTCEPTHGTAYAPVSSLSGDHVPSAVSRVSCRENEENKQKRCVDRVGRGTHVGHVMVAEESSRSNMDNWRNGKVARCFGSYTEFFILLTDYYYGLSKKKIINGRKSPMPDTCTVLNALMKKLGAFPCFSKAYNDIRKALRTTYPKADGKPSVSSALRFSAKPSNISTNKDSHLRFRKCLKEIVRLYYKHTKRPEGVNRYNMEEISGEDKVDNFQVEVENDQRIRVTQYHNRVEGSGSLQNQNFTSSTHESSTSRAAPGRNLPLCPTESVHHRDPSRPPPTPGDLKSEVERLRAEVSRLKAGQSIETFKHIKSHQVTMNSRGLKRSAPKSSENEGLRLQRAKLKMELD